MRLDVFNEATELYNKYKLCEEVLEYLSNEEAVKGQKYKETLAKFAETFKLSFMMFVHERMTASGEAFENLKCCDCDKQNEENPDTPPEDAKFHIGDRVEVVKSLSSIMIGSVGTVEDYDSDMGNYGVRLDRFPSDALLQWYAEDELELYKELEEPEQPTPPPFPEDAKFQLGERVVVNGNVGTIVGYDFIDHKYAVLFDSDDEKPGWYAEDEIEPCTFAVGDRVWLNTSGGEKLLGTIMSYVGEANRYIIDVVDEDGTTHTYHASPNEIEKYIEDGGTVTPDKGE